MTHSISISYTSNTGLLKSWASKQEGNQSHSETEGFSDQVTGVIQDAILGMPSVSCIKAIS